MDSNIDNSHIDGFGRTEEEKIKLEEARMKKLFSFPIQANTPKKMNSNDLLTKLDPKEREKVVQAQNLLETKNQNKNREPEKEIKLTSILYF